jgi:hypothetical protein
VPNRIGNNFSAAQMQATITLSRGEGMDAGLPDRLRFLSGAVKSLLARRLHVEGREIEDSSKPAIFFLGNMPSDVPGEPKKMRLLSQGIADFTGKHWFMNVEASVGTCIDHDLDGEELLDFAKSHAVLRTLPTLLYVPDAESSPLVYFEAGVSNEESHRAEYDFASVTVASPSETRAAIDRLYDQSMKTPNGLYGSAKLWKNGAKYEPVPDTEKAIQALVRSAFIGAFPGLHATEEEMTEAGRFDIALVSKTEGTKVYLGLLELKVLRKGVNPTESIEKGINQAFAYAKEWQIPWAQLCSFDMRDVEPSDDPYANYRAKAAELNVLLERWFLHSTHDRYRAHVTEAVLKAS